jgi:hypothetical protein
VAPHAAFAVHQALCSPRTEIRHSRAEALGDDTWRLEVGVANTGWLPTQISERATKEQLVRPLTVEVSGDSVEVVGGPARQQLGQLAGRAAMRFAGRSDGTPDRVLTTWVVRAPRGTEVEVVARHPRAGDAFGTLRLE